jgi:LuxR family maltose regulon positive regulatory protein
MHTLIPALRPTRVFRRRLLDRLARWRNHPLIVITAPAGFGKTTLVGDWISLLLYSAQPSDPLCAWLSLGGEDADPDVFLQHVTEALAIHVPGLSQLAAAADAGDVSREQFVRSAAEKLTACAGDVVLVLDDYHQASHEVLTLTQKLLDHAPLSFHLVLVSRTMPPLTARPLLSSTEALHIDGAEMRFDHDEFIAFMRQENLDGLDETQRAAIEQRAEGWITGLHLLAQAGNAQLDSYTDAAVLRPLPPDLRRFLVDVAPLPYLTADLCSVATQRNQDACLHLLQLAADTVAFITRFRRDGAAELLRIHPLLRDVLLRERATRTDVTSERTLRRSAALHIAASGEVDAAIQLVSNSDVEATAAVLTLALRPALMRYELASARRWLALLPTDAIAAHPQIAVDAAWLEYFGETPHICAAVARAQIALEHRPPDASAASAELHAEVGTLDVLRTFLDGAHERARAAADQLHALPHDPNGLAAGYLQLFEGYVPHDPANADARIHAMQRAADIFRRAGHSHGTIEAIVTQAYIKRRYANAEGTISGLTHALSFMHATGWEHSLFAADAAHACGEMLYLVDRIPEARAMLQRALEAARVHGAVPAIPYMARVCLHLCDIAANDALSFDETEDAQHWAAVLTGNSTMASIGSAGMLRILRDQRLGHRERCRQTAESIGIAPADLTDDMHDVFWYTTLAGAILSQRTGACIQNKLVHFRERMVAAHNDWMRLRIDVLDVLLACSHGREDEARTALLLMLPEIERSGMPRLVSDYDALQPLLESIPHPYAQRLAFRHTKPSATAHPFGLTRQEMQVAQMLVGDKTRDEIAQAMFLSKFTIRAHLRSLYKKLGVHDRAEAIKVARRAGIGEKRVDSR